MQENLKERDHWEVVDVDGRKTLTWILKKQEGRAWIGSVWLRIGSIGFCCEGGNESSGSIQYGEFLGWLRNCQLLKKYPVPCSCLFPRTIGSACNSEQNVVTPYQRQT
jgi:hypothetical protein